MRQYRELVDSLFGSKRHPSVDGLAAGSVVKRCWKEEYSDVRALIEDQCKQFEVIYSERE